MGIVVGIHARIAAPVLNPNTVGSTSSGRRASQNVKKWSEGIEPRLRQLLTADGLTPASEADFRGPPAALITPSTDLIMPDNNSQSVKMSSVHNTAIENARCRVPNGSMGDDPSNIANRLRRLVTALELEPADIEIFCPSKSRWSQYWRADRVITREIAEHLCDKYGATLDWIYRGNPGGMSPDLLKNIYRTPEIIPLRAASRKRKKVPAPSRRVKI